MNSILVIGKVISAKIALLNLLAHAGIVSFSETDYDTSKYLESTTPNIIIYMLPGDQDALKQLVGIKNAKTEIVFFSLERFADNADLEIGKVSQKLSEAFSRKQGDSGRFDCLKALRAELQKE